MNTRRRAWGADVGARGTQFRVLAPGRDGVEVVVEDGRATRTFRLEPEGATGVWRGDARDVGAGALYRYRLSGEDELLPDPASRFQPHGVAGPSEVVDPTFAWTDAACGGIEARGRVVYELHVGTFTPEGTWEAARARLPELARLGVTVIELMPVGAFAGERGWGYDGVLWFAPHHAYGRPDDLRRFVDDAHRLGVGVILDVVFNHMGNVGNVLPRFSRDYTGSKPNAWGGALNFDEGAARPARALVTENVTAWIDEYHVDGFRFDATQSILDASTPHILTEAVAVARAAAGRKTLYLVGENEPQDSRLARAPAQGGAGLDALWNDDFHHAALVALTGHRDGYFTDYSGTARELAACVRHGFLYQGQRYHWQRAARGRSTRGLAPRAFVTFLENHDQLANYGLGARLSSRAAPGRLRALTALMLLAPSTPMLFQGQEWSATARFAYFAAHEREQASAVKLGRAEFLQQFKRYGGSDARDRFPDPAAIETFEACRLDWTERDAPVHQRALALHRDLLELRRADPTVRLEGADGVTVDAAALNDHALVVRYFGLPEDGAEDRLLVVNLGADLEPSSISEPLVAPPHGTVWLTHWSTDDPRYGGEGVRDTAPDRALFLPGEAAVFLVPAAAPPEPPPKDVS